VEDDFAGYNVYRIEAGDTVILNTGLLPAPGYTDSTVVPAVAYGTQVTAEFFSPRLGCRVFPPLGFGVDLASLCLVEPSPSGV